MVTNEQQKKIKEFAQGKPIQLVYLFGSQATGEEKPTSDYDFAVLFDNTLSSQERFRERLETISFLGKILKTEKIDVVDLDSAPPILRYEAIAPRKDIYTSSDDVRTEFEHKAMTDYFDRLFYLKRHTLVSLGTIANEGLKR